MRKRQIRFSRQCFALLLYCTFLGLSDFGAVFGTMGAGLSLKQTNKQTNENTLGLLAIITNMKATFVMHDLHCNNNNIKY